MITYYIDSQNPTRNWGHLIPNSEPIELDEILQPAEDDSRVTVVIHGTAFNNLLSSNLVEKLNQQQNLVAIFISGGGNYDAGIEHDRLYARQTPVAADGADQGFKECFTSFSQALQNGKLDFSLLEPDPGHLYAFRLLCEAYSYSGEGINKPSQLNEWLAPFKTGDENPTIESVSAFMGNKKQEVNDILKAIMEKNSDADQLITKFVEQTQ